jgi:hypothetical protein
MSSFTTTIARRLVNAARYLATGGVMPAEPPQAARVGLLNTGELIVLPAHGGQLVLSPETTQLVRDALDDDGFATRVPVPFGGSN